MKTTQLTRTLDYLKTHGRCNTNELRNALKIVDVPKVISTLNKKGYSISSTRKHDGTADYEYTRVDTSLGHWCFLTGSAVRKMVEERDCECSSSRQVELL